MKRQFPCILQGLHVWLALDKSNATTLDSDHGKNKGNINFEHDGFKNITTEYLSNTYGEVKSKEHAEFIVKLSGGDSSLIGNSWSQSLKCFVIDSDGKVSFGSRVYHQEKVDKREITIPLPPECESADEWPKVGSSVEWGHTGKGEVKSLSDGFAWIKLDNKDYTTVYVSSLRKPKTPEHELIEAVTIQLESIIGDNLDNYSSIVNAIASAIVKNKISGFEVTKKPQ